jgi:uncharacterized membrane protein YhhN
MFWASVIATAVFVLATLLFERLGSRSGAGLAKTLASAGFVVAAYFAGALASLYGTMVFAALVLGAIGDVLLVPKDERAFLLGLFVFLVGHGGYIAAFWIRGANLTIAAVALAALAVLAVFVWRWLAPHVAAKMKAPVAIYIAAIAVMVALALGTGVEKTSLPIVVGAIAFFLSDLSVARDRFVHPSIENKLWGLPLYYFAQLLFAASTRT